MSLRAQVAKPRSVLVNVEIASRTVLTPVGRHRAGPAGAASVCQDRLATTLVIYFNILSAHTSRGKMPCSQKQTVPRTSLGIIARKEIFSWQNAQTVANPQPLGTTARSPSELPTARSNRTCRRRSSWKAAVPCIRCSVPNASRRWPRLPPKVHYQITKSHDTKS